MEDQDKTKKQLIDELEQLREQILELKRLEAEQKRTEEALRKSEERFRAIFELAEDSIFIKDKALRYTDVNPAMERLFDLPGSELIGKADDELFGKEAGALIRKMDSKVLDGEVIKEESSKPVKGIMKTFQVIKVPMKDSSGKVIGLCGIARDITSRKRIDEALQRAHDKLEERIDERTNELLNANMLLKQKIAERKQAEEALQKAEQEKAIILGTMSELVIYVDTNMKILWANQAAIHSVGLTADALVGSYCYKEWFHRNDPCPHCPAKRVLETGQVQEGETYSSDGRVWFFRGYPVRDASGEVKAIVEVVEEITKRKQAEEEKKRLELQLQQAQKMEAIGTLAGGIAHDFNNLLMGIQGNVSLMLMNMEPTHGHYQRLRNIERQVRSGAGLTARILGYARKGRYEVRPVDLNRMVKETTETFGRTRKQITIDRKLSKDLSPIKADAGQIEQVLLNLLVNAADAMSARGNLVLKTINTNHKDMMSKFHDPAPGNYVLLIVTDTGTGMSKETMERIFDPFFSTKEIGHGTGLGLASSYGIVKGHGGYIDVDSQEGRGTTFSIYLPASKRGIQRPGQGAERFVKGAGTVLLVDDEEVILNVGRDLLEAMGYRVLVARDGKGALAVYKEHQEDIRIVVLDMIMPNMSGGEAYDRMKEINPDVKVLLSSGYSIDGQATEILKRGCDGFIQKPFIMEKLSERLRNITSKALDRTRTDPSLTTL